MAGATKNIVEFGVKEIHIGTYTVASDGTVTLGTPIALPGAKSISLDPEGDDNKFYADDTIYWSGYSDNGYSGSMEVALFTDEFKTAFLGYVTLADGGIANIKGAERKKVYIAFQTKGDALDRRGILYNVTLGGIKREYASIEDKKEPTTESMDITVNGDNKTGIALVNYKKGDTGYDTLFTTPPVPTLPTEG